MAVSKLEWSLVLQSRAGEVTLLSYLDAYSNNTLKERIVSGDNTAFGNEITYGRDDFVNWVDGCGL